MRTSMTVSSDSSAWKTRTGTIRRQAPGRRIRPRPGDHGSSDRRLERQMPRHHQADAVVDPHTSHHDATLTVHRDGAWVIRSMLEHVPGVSEVRIENARVRHPGHQELTISVAGHLASHRDQIAECVWRRRDELVPQREVILREATPAKLASSAPVGVRRTMSASEVAWPSARMSLSGNTESPTTIPPVLRGAHPTRPHKNDSSALRHEPAAPRPRIRVPAL